MDEVQYISNHHYICVYINIYVYIPGGLHSNCKFLQELRNCQRLCTVKFIFVFQNLFFFHFTMVAPHWTE
jgi:hypothetical protein